MKKRIAVLMTVALLFIAFVPMKADAAPRYMKTTVYDYVIKSGNTLYCAGAEGLYKVVLNNKGFVIRTTLLHKKMCPYANSFYKGMKKQGRYIYMQEYTLGTVGYLTRIDITNGRGKWLATSHEGRVDYVLHQNKILFKTYEYGGGAMNLDGSNKRKSCYTPYLTHWQSTTKGYYMSFSKRNGMINSYLTTPKGTYLLGSHKQ